MTIQHLKKLEQNKIIRNSKLEGVSESAIKQVEIRLNIKFPETYKEYLYLAGEYNGGLIMFPGHNDLATLSSDLQQKYLKEQLSYANLKIDRPFWVFTEADGFQQFLFFYLDEDPIDPEVYGVTYRKESEYYVYDLGKKFSEYEDAVIDRSILSDQRGY